MNSIVRRAAIRVWQQWIRPLVVIVVVTTAVRSSLADWYVVPTGSMKPNIIEGDRIFVNKLAYDLKVPFTRWRLLRWADPSASDVVVFFAPGCDTRMVKRVVGLPGDTVEVRGLRVLVNGQPLKLQPCTAETELPVPAGGGVFLEALQEHCHPILTSGGNRAGRFFGPVTVPEDHFFVLGDHRDRSRDSRYFGFVHRDRIIGRSSRIVLSLNAQNHYLPRGDRFLRALP